MAAPPTIPIDAERQLPLGTEIFLDHVGHFIPDADAASRALTRAGFAPAPKSIQVADGQLTGTGNVTAMLEARLHRSAVQDRRYVLGARVRCQHGPLCGIASDRVCGCRCESGKRAARGQRVPRAPDRRIAAAGGDGQRRGDGRLYGRARRRRPNARGTHPVSYTPHRGCRLAEALAHPSQRRECAAGCRSSRSRMWTKRPRAMCASSATRPCRPTWGAAFSWNVAVCSWSTRPASRASCRR